MRMLKELIKLANELDERGLVKEAGILDKIIRIAAEEDDEETLIERPGVPRHFESLDQENEEAYQQWMHAGPRSLVSGAPDELREKLFEKLFPFINLLLNTDLEESQYEGTDEERDAADKFMQAQSEDDLAAITNAHDIFYGEE